MSRNAVAFCWTLPVPWAGFTSLPKGIEAASSASMTIRYQRAVIAEYARKQRYRLVHEDVFMEIEPDRGSDVILAPLAKVEQICRAHDAVLLLVDFSEVQGWRSHPPLHRWSSRTEIVVEPVSPEPIAIDGCDFDPHEHFSQWRDQQVAWSAGKADRTAQAITRALALKRDGASYRAAAERLNDEGVRSATGRPWTGENLRKLLANASTAR
jgi:hypothetical protein